MLASAPRVENRGQNIASTSAGKFRACGDREGEAHHERDVLPLKRDAEHDRERAEHERRRTRDAKLFPVACMTVAHHVDPQIMRECRGARERQPGDDGENRRERHSRDEAEEWRAADDFRQEGRGHVAAGVDRANPILPDEDHRAEAQHEREQVKEPDERGGNGGGIRLTERACCCRIHARVCSRSRATSAS